MIWQSCHSEKVKLTVVKCVVAHSKVIVPRLVDRDNGVYELNSGLSGADTLMGLSHGKLNEIRGVANGRLVAAE